MIPFKRKGWSFVTGVAMVVLATVAIFAACMGNHMNSEGLDSLYELVDEEIDRSQNYTEAKEQRIADLKDDLTSEISDGERLRVYDKLIEEYESYVSDSAMKYVKEARVVAEKAGNRHARNRLLIKKADIASHAGLFSEAHNMLASVPRNELDTALLTNLYWAYTALYQYEYEYMPDGEFAERSNELRGVYTDSLMMVTDTTSFSYLTNWTTPQIKAGNFDTVRTRLEDNLKKYKPGDRRYSIIASTMASMYREMGYEDEEKRYLSMTVISDIRGAVKENMAMRELATAVFEDGDIDRANRYMKASIQDANFYSSSMRNAQSNRMLPVIDKAYDNRVKKQQKVQLGLIYVTSGLLLVAVIAIIFNMWQVRRVKEASRRERESNAELSEMSERLRQANEALERTNSELKNSSRTTEEYAGLFMEYCSLTISNLQRYHLALHNLALQGNVKGILKKLDSGDVTTDTLRGFYMKFDEAILNIYPSFVERVNSLLKPDSQIVVKGSEKLNTELRILALIRIGMSDSEKIAEFLRCSLATIYTYRSAGETACPGR